MANLKIGSKGDEVKQLQTALNATGNYNLKVDGIFGKDTDKAVRDYQGKNKLSVDGIAGVKTLGALGVTEKQPAVSAKPASVSIRDQAMQNYLNLQANKPGEYGKPYAQQIDDAYKSIMNREAFNYDFNGDPLYQLYKDQYVQGGQTAMQDTMAQAAALTGGYGNSYASAVGNQAYQQYLKGLNDVIPELQQAAYNRYLNEGQEMADRLNTLMALDNNEYNRWSDDYNRWNSELSNSYNIYDNERNVDYNTENNAYNRKLQEAQLAASVGDLSKLEKLGIDTSKYSAAGGSSSEDYKKTTERWRDPFKEWSATMTKKEMANTMYPILNSGGTYGNADALFAIAYEFGFADELYALVNKDSPEVLEAEKKRKEEEALGEAMKKITEREKKEKEENDREKRKREKTVRDSAFTNSDNGLNSKDRNYWPAYGNQNGLQNSGTTYMSEAEARKRATAVKK